MTDADGRCCRQQTLGIFGSMTEMRRGCVKTGVGAFSRRARSRDSSKSAIKSTRERQKWAQFAQSVKRPEFSHSLRTNRTDASAAWVIADLDNQRRSYRCNAAGFPESGHSTTSGLARSEQVVRCVAGCCTYADTASSQPPAAYRTSGCRRCQRSRVPLFSYGGRLIFEFLVGRPAHQARDYALRRPSSHAGGVWPSVVWLRPDLAAKFCAVPWPRRRHWAHDA